MTKSDFFSGLFLSSRVLTEGYVRECFYQPAARRRAGPKITLRFPRLLVYLCVRMYAIITSRTLLPCDLDFDEDIRRLLCVATMSSIATIMSSLAQLRVRDRYRVNSKFPFPSLNRERYRLAWARGSLPWERGSAL